MIATSDQAQQQQIEQVQGAIGWGIRVGLLGWPTLHGGHTSTMLA